MLCNVDCGAVKRSKDSIFKNRNTHAANVPHLSIWSNNPLGYVTATALFMHHPNGFLHGGSVIRVDRGQIPLKVRRPVLWIKTKNFVYLVRPINAQIVSPTDTQIFCRPTPHMCEALPFAQVKLASTQGLLPALAIGDVLGRTEHL